MGRVVLDHELKRDYQRWRNDRDRDRDDESHGERTAAEVSAWAHEHDLPYFDEQVHFPDARIEYHEPEDERWRCLDIEIETPHYRGAHAASVAQSGFSRYSVGSISVGGRGGGGGRWRIAAAWAHGGVPVMPATLFCDRVRALRALGYTPRQLRFLRLVLRCGGVCVPRQYASHAGIAPGGRKCLGFFARLVRRGHAVRLRCGHNRAHVYHVHGRALDAAFGDDASRYRRAMSPALVVLRLMRLDAALMTPDAASYAALTDIDLRGGWRAIEPATGPDDGSVSGDQEGAPSAAAHPPGGHRSRGRDRVRVPRHGGLAGPLPAGPAGPARAPRQRSTRGRCFVVFSAPLARLTRAYQTMVREELESPLTDDDVQGLWRLFLRRRDGAASSRFWSSWPGVAATGDKLFTRPRFSALYRHWMEVDAAAFEPLRSTAAADAIAAGRGRVTYRTLAHDYDHLVPLTDDEEGSADDKERSTEEDILAHRLNPGSQPRAASPSVLPPTLDHVEAGVLVARSQPQEQQADADRAQLSLFAVSQRRGSSA